MSDERKGDRTRERILSAASQLIAETGGASFQMVDISERCGISKSAPYYYFHNQEEIIDELLSRSVDGVAEEVSHAISDARSAQEALGNVCQAFARSLDMRGTFAKILAAELQGDGTNAVSGVARRLATISQLVEVQLERAKTEGVVREDLDARLSASCICGAFLFAAVEQAACGDEASGKEGLDERLAGLVAHGVCAASASS